MANIFDEFDSVNQQQPEVQATPQANSFDSFDEYSDKDTREKQIETGSWYSDPTMASRMVIDGLTLGWGDEAGAGVAAGVAKMMGDEKPYTEIYRDMKNSLDAEEAKYRQEHPVASIGLNIAGGLMTGGIGANKAVGHQILKAGIGGGVAGAGTAKEGDTLKGAAVGTLFGVGTGSLMKGGGWLWDAGTKRRITQELGMGDKFIPMHIAADPANTSEATIGSFYKTVVGTSFGGGARLKSQEARLMNPIALRLSNAQDSFKSASKNATDAVKTVKANIARVKADKVSIIRDAKVDVRANALDEQSLIKESFKSTKDQALMNATKQIDDSVSEAERAFRAQAVLKSIPEGMGDDVIDEILTSKTPNIAMQKLDEVWARDGFKMLKERKFQINADSVGLEIKTRLKNDFAAMDKASFQKLTDDVTNFLKERTQKGWIDGEDLSAIRSRLGMLANAKSDAGGQAAVEQAIFKEMQDVLNTKVKSQLSGKALSAFEAQTGQWKANSTLRLAINSASRQAGKQGEFSADDWVQAIGKMSPRDARQGSGVLRSEADNVAILGVQRDKSIQDTANLVVSRAEEQKMKSLTSVVNRTKLEVKALEQEASKIRGKTGETVALRRARNADELATKKQKIEELERAVNSIKSASATDNATTFTRLAATLALGLGNLFTGAAAGGGFSSQGVQRVVAGQSVLQKVLNNYGNKVGGTALQAGANTSGVLSNESSIPTRIPFKDQQGQQR
jgi:hypothetical protein